MESNFEELLGRVFSSWLTIIGVTENSGSIKIDMGILEKFYGSEMEPAAQASGSMLFIQLDWIVYGALCSVLKIAHVVHLEEIRKDYLKERFHRLLLTVGVTQLEQAAQADGSFDLVELAAYLKHNGLHRGAWRIAESEREQAERGHP